MYCKNCGKYIKNKEYDYCPYCSCPITKVEKEDSENSFIFSILCFIVLSLTIILFAFQQDLYFIFYILTGLMLIYGKKKYKKNLVITILFWLWILSFVIVLFIVAVVLFFCASCVAGVPEGFG